MYRISHSCLRLDFPLKNENVKCTERLPYLYTRFKLFCTADESTDTAIHRLHIVSGGILHRCRRQHHHHHRNRCQSEVEKVGGDFVHAQPRHRRRSVHTQSAVHGSQHVDEAVGVRRRTVQADVRIARGLCARFCIQLGADSINYRAKKTVVTREPLRRRHRVRTRAGSQSCG
jgi:hypothetical protein